MNLKDLLAKQEKHSLLLAEINFLKDVLLAIDSYNSNIEALKQKEKEYELIQEQLDDDSISVRDHNNTVIRSKIVFNEILDLEEKIEIVEELQKSEKLR